MNQPKTSYQDFLKDIYSAMKKINQNTIDIFGKLEMLDARLSNLEKSYVLLSTDVKELKTTSSQCEPSPSITGEVKYISPAKASNSKLLSLLTQLNDTSNDTGMSVYNLGTETALETVTKTIQPKSPETYIGSPNNTQGIVGSLYDNDNFESLSVDSYRDSSMKNTVLSNDFIILE